MLPARRGWHPCLFAEAAIKNSARLSGAPYGLDCEACPRGQRCDEWGEELNTGYRFEGQNLLGHEWDACPVSYLRSPHLNRALEIYRQSRVFGALDGYPSKWSAWVVSHLVMIHEAIEAQRAESMKR